MNLSTSKYLEWNARRNRSVWLSETSAWISTGVGRYENLIATYIEIYLVCQSETKRSECSAEGHWVVEGNENICIHLHLSHWSPLKYKLYFFTASYQFLNILLCSLLSQTMYANSLYNVSEAVWVLVLAVQGCSQHDIEANQGTCLSHCFLSFSPLMKWENEKRCLIPTGREFNYWPIP